MTPGKWGAASDYPETAIERLAAAPADDGPLIREIWLLRLRALLAQAQGDQIGYRDCMDRYGDMAKSLGFGGISSGPRRCRDRGWAGIRASCPRSCLSQATLGSSAHVTA